MAIRWIEFGGDRTASQDVVAELIDGLLAAAQCTVDEAGDGQAEETAHAVFQDRAAEVGPGVKGGGASEQTAAVY